MAQASRELAAVNAEPIELDSNNDGHFDAGKGGGVGDICSPPLPNDSNNIQSPSGGSESRDTHANSFPPNEDSRASMHSTGSNISPRHHLSDSHPGTPLISQPLISLNFGGANAKKKKLEVKDIFNNNDDSEDLNGTKKRKLVKIFFIHPLKK